MANIFQKFQSFQIPFLSAMHIYFDLGTANTRIAVQDKGIVLKEPTYLGYNSRIKEFIFFGAEAKTIVGKTPDFIKIIRPIVNGVLSDFDAEVAFIKKEIEKSVYPYFANRSFLKPTMRALVAIPSIATEIERKAVEEALVKSGMSNVALIEKPLATAAGCGFDIFSHHPRLVIDFGAGIIELSIISGGGIVTHRTIKNAGDHMNKLIANYTYLKHGIILGERACEDLKIELLNFTNEEKIGTVRGKSLETGLPKSVKIKTSDIKEALLMSFNHITDTTKELIEVSPPEIADEIFKHGITLTGMMAGIPGIDLHFGTELKIDTYIAEHYADATTYGLMELDKRPDDLFRLFGYR